MQYYNYFWCKKGLREPEQEKKEGTRTPPFILLYQEW